jgi:hypothetical protein
MIRNFIANVLGVNLETDDEVRGEINQELDVLEQQQAEAGRLQQVEQIQPEPSVAQQQPQRPEREGARIIFAIDAHGQVTIQVQWNSMTTPVAHALGTLFHFINEGNLRDQCEMVLNETAVKDPKARPFIKEVASAWKKAHSRDEPVVKPSEVFQMGRQLVTRPTHAGGGPGGPQ